MSLDPDIIINVINSLLGPNGCPWDKEQTPRSLCDYLIEETYELVEAIRSPEISEVKEELGDVFFLLFFIAKLYENKSELDLEDVWKQNAHKMTVRHPHVFEDTELKNREELFSRWEQIKKEEKENKTRPTDPFASLPSTLPPLLKAYRIQAKAARNNFTWENDQDQEQALLQEWNEWQAAQQKKKKKKKEEEFGDFLFSLIEQGRRHGIKANAALHSANQKFLRRFEAMQSLATSKGLSFDSLSLEAKNELWEEIKKRESDC